MTSNSSLMNFRRAIAQSPGKLYEAFQTWVREVIIDDEPNEQPDEGTGLTSDFRQPSRCNILYFEFDQFEEAEC